MNKERILGIILLVFSFVLHIVYYFPILLPHKVNDYYRYTVTSNILFIGIVSFTILVVIYIILMKKKSLKWAILVPIIAFIVVFLPFLRSKIITNIIDTRCRRGNSTAEGGCVSDMFIENSKIENPVDCLEIDTNDCIGPEITIRNECGRPYIINGVEYIESNWFELKEGEYEFVGEIDGKTFTVKGKVVAPCN